MSSEGASTQHTTLPLHSTTLASCSQDATAANPRAHALQLLRNTLLLTPSIQPASASLLISTQQAEPITTPFHQIGHGTCGAVFTSPSTPLVWKQALPKQDANLLHEHALQQRTYAIFAQHHERLSRAGENTILLPLVPAAYDHFTQAEVMPGGLFENMPFPRWTQPVAIRSSQKIWPVPRAIREALIDAFLLGDEAEHERMKQDTKNDDCIVRVYLGREKPPKREGSRLGRLGGLWNFRLFVDMAREMLAAASLHLPLATQDDSESENDRECKNDNSNDALCSSKQPAKISATTTTQDCTAQVCENRLQEWAAAMGRAYAICHWSCQHDANDVEFVLGCLDDSSLPSSTATTEAPEEHRVSLWMLDFDKVRHLPWTKSGMRQAVQSVLRNDPYVQGPLTASGEAVTGDARDLWIAFRKAYLCMSESVAGEMEERGWKEYASPIRRLMGMFVDAEVWKEEHDGMKTKSRYGVDGQGQGMGSVVMKRRLDVENDVGCWRTLEDPRR